MITYWKRSFDRTQFNSNFKKFWVVQNQFPIKNMLNKINPRKKTLLTFCFSTLLPHFFITFKVVSKIIKFVFDSALDSTLLQHLYLWHIRIKATEKHFPEAPLANANFQLTTLYLNVVFYGQTYFFIFFESKYLQQLILSGFSRADRYLSRSRFIDDSQ